MPMAAAQSSWAPTIDVIQGHMISSPDPMASPAMTMPGPIILTKDFLRAGRSASLKDGMGTGMDQSLCWLLRSRRSSPMRRELGAVLFRLAFRFHVTLTQDVI